MTPAYKPLCKDLAKEWPMPKTALVRVVPLKGRRQKHVPTCLWKIRIMFLSATFQSNFR